MDFTRLGDWVYADSECAPGVLGTATVILAVVGSLDAGMAFWT